MIDWVGVALNAVWIAGLAIVLAAFSYHDWLARETDRRLRDVLALPSWKLTFFGGMLLACVGFAYGLSDRWWQKVIWMILALSFAYELMLLWRQGRPKGDS